MSGHSFAENQPDNFEFTPETEAKADAIIKKYPQAEIIEKAKKRLKALESIKL